MGKRDIHTHIVSGEGKEEMMMRMRVKKHTGKSHTF
jgi:hypothetical protein